MSGTAKRIARLEADSGALMAGVTVPREDLVSLFGEDLAGEFIAARHVFQRHETALVDLAECG